MTGPLQGIKVVEFSQIIAGPLAGMLLSDLGADVIKVEPPSGDPWRRPQIGGPGQERVFIAVNRGKRSVTLDLKTEGGQSASRRLTSTADVVIVNNRPDVPARLGIDYDTLSGGNPRLVYCEITAYGPEGPDSHLPGYDLIMQGYAGLISSEGKMLDGRPVPVVSTPAIDFATGHSISAAVSAALFHREQTGKGQHIELSLLANGLLLQSMALTRLEEYLSPAQEWTDNDLPLLREAGAPYSDAHALYYEKRTAPLYQIYYRAYKTADWAIMVGCLSDPLRKRLSDFLGLGDPRFEPGYDATTPEYERLLAEMVRQAEELFLSKTSEEWIAELREAGIPVGPVRFVDEMIDHPQALANGMIVEQHHSALGRVRTVGPIYSMSETPPAADRPSPVLGEHTDEVMREIGYSEREIEGLRRTGAFG